MKKIKVMKSENILQEQYKIHKNCFIDCGLEEKEYEELAPLSTYFSLDSGGWEKFITKIPFFPSSIKEIIEEKIMEEIEICSPKVFGELLLIAAKFLFQKLGLQAQNKINTSGVEGKLKTIKQILLLLPEIIGVIPSRKYLQIDRDSSLSILRKIPEGINTFLISSTTTSFPCKEVNILGADFLLLFPFNQTEISLPVLKWTGSELVAIHTENLPQILVDKGLLQIEQERG